MKVPVVVRLEGESNLQNVAKRDFINFFLTCRLRRARNNYTLAFVGSNFIVSDFWRTQSRRGEYSVLTWMPCIEAASKF